MQAHEHWMHICLELAQQALSTGNPPVGSLIVREGEIIGRGVEAGKSKNDITYHAEIEAIRSAVASTQSRHLPGCVLYTTHEPCILCAYAIRHYRISCVVMGTTVPHIGGYSSTYPILTASDIPIWTTPPLIVTGVCQEACEQLSYLYQNPT